MFPLTKKMHQMNTRKIEKYYVNHAHTERLQKSAVPYMQRLLNEFENRWNKKKTDISEAFNYR